LCGTLREKTGEYKKQTPQIKYREEFAMRANIERIGNDRVIRLPNEILSAALFGENDTVEIAAEANQIILRKTTKVRHKTLKQRLENFDGEYTFTEWDTGAPVGNEVL
jgi:antitoxin MazE